jgi:soluble cytochrome b562
MAAIKTALELAMERTANVKGDAASIGSYGARQRGKKAANDYLTGGEGTKKLSAALKDCPKDEREAFRQGIFDLLITQLDLPAAKEDEGRIQAAAAGLEILIDKKEFNQVVGQFAQIIQRYSSEVQRYDAGLRQQYEPQLRQKEEALSAQLGQPIKLDPFSDPQFV